jgi:hypothetical protein
MLNAFDVEYIDLVALLWQTGYLTFAEKLEEDENVMYRMKVPNMEVQKSLHALFLQYLIDYRDTHQWAAKVREAFRKGDLESFRQVLVSLFSQIPYHNYVNNSIWLYEGYYASVLYAFVSSSGLSVIAEDATNRGRIDMTVLGAKAIFILEFKVDMPQEMALEQIKTKRYFEKYLNRGLPIFLVGVQFDSATRNIGRFEYEELEA